MHNWFHNSDGYRRGRNGHCAGRKSGIDTGEKGIVTAGGAGMNAGIISLIMGISGIDAVGAGAAVAGAAVGTAGVGTGSAGVAAGMLGAGSGAAAGVLGAGTAGLVAAVMSAENAALACLAGISVVTDLARGKIYNAVTLPGLLLGIGLSAWRGGAVGILEVLCAAAFTVLVLVPFCGMGGLGAGDVKLLAAVSAFMPSGEYLRCFAGAFVIGGCVGLVRLLVSRGKRRTLHFAVPVAASVFLHIAGVL